MLDASFIFTQLSVRTNPAILLNSIICFIFIFIFALYRQSCEKVQRLIFLSFFFFFLTYEDHELLSSFQLRFLHCSLLGCQR